ncbi:MAG TPA: type I restriction enzyme HsdR N-terminal domain-containing protein [Verrucomicrobiae bacterium]|nr:type I restriction enzyme HsdR N-terminal domain-containing protein [Verrucomicrobiae bacterium]
MATIPSRVESRMIGAIKKFQPILVSAKTRDVNEPDTVRMVTEILADVFGYDKFSEVTAEHAIRGTFCDLATKLDGAIQLLIEVKAIGLDLKDAHVKQAVDYAANKGVEWVVLTNAIIWRVYKVTFGKPIDHELIYEVDFVSFDTKKKDQLELLFVLTREGWIKSLLTELQEQRQALSKFAIAAVTRAEPVLDAMRRELKRACPNVKILNEQIEQVLMTEVLKREVVEGEKADEAQKKISKSNRRAKIAVASSAPVSKPASQLTPTAIQVPNPTVPPLASDQEIPQ